LRKDFKKSLNKKISSKKKKGLVDENVEFVGLRNKLKKKNL